MLSPRPVQGKRFGTALLQPADSPVPRGIIADGRVQQGLVELRPEKLRHPDLGIADLPQQEIAHPHLLGRANQQVRLGHAGRVKMGGNRLLADLVGVEPCRF